MKTIPPTCPEAETGQKYWRSLDHLADAPEFRQWLEREFPDGASEFSDPVSRRHFVKIMAASFALGGMGIMGTGCRRPEEKILPFGKAQEQYIHGVPQFFATAMPTRGSAVPLVAKAHDGRPVKVEGNAEHPDSNGGTDLLTQASVLSLYDPDRAQRFTQNGNTVPKQAALDFLDAEAKRFQASRGAGLCFLMEQSSSPSRARLQNFISLKFPLAKWYTYEPVDLGMSRAAASSLAGQNVSPFYRLEKAKVILTLDCDFVGSEQDSQRHIRGFATGRKVVQPTDPMNRLYAVESLYSLTGVNADHRLRVPASQVVAVAAALATQMDPSNPAFRSLAQKFPLPKSVKPEWVTECAKDLAANRNSSLIMAGYSQPAVVHVLALALNQALGNLGNTVDLLPTGQPADYLSSLRGALDGGQVDTLVILGANPVLTAPADFKWAETQAKAKNIIRLGYYEDETFGKSTWHLPAAHYLESWGDARTSDGTLVPVQPLIQPLFGGMTEIEVLARIGGMDRNSAYDVVRDTFREEVRKAPSGGDLDNAWKKFLHDGFLAGSAARHIPAVLLPNQISLAVNQAVAALNSPAPSKESLEVIFRRDLKVDDGRWANNGWLQELPDPITKITWDNVITVSRLTAEELGLQSKDVVEIELSGQKIRGPVWVQPGQSDYTVGLALGYGRRFNKKDGGVGRVANNVGLYNAYAIRTSNGEYIASGAKLRKTGETYAISSTQEHGSMEGRPIVREANKEQFEKHPGFARKMDLDAHGDYIPTEEKQTPIELATQGSEKRPQMLYKNPYKAFEETKSQAGVNLSHLQFVSDVNQWGMSVNLTMCVGCTACVVACQSENNIPIVGKDQVSRNREMHWLRLDRYYSGASEKSQKDLIDDPQAVVQPMMCQHCENAPCESVCPVNATVHDEEGLNVMAYNRCVGTRYCSNNCPYKVRRFNFFDYNKHSLDKLYQSPLVSSTDGEWNLKRWWNNPNAATIPEEEFELLKLVRNPEVSVRMRGVMEKCTFCVQRIESAKIKQKVKARASGAVQVPDGTFQTACQQACPADAITFGNLLDPQSEISKLRAQNRDYSVLNFLDTRPRVTYLARIRNPNPKMPDYHEVALNIKEYWDQQHGEPYAEHAHPAEPGHGAPAGAAPAHGETKGAH